MQLENHAHTKQITLPSFTSLPQCQHFTTPTPTPHHFSCGRSSALRSSLDTPLSTYATNRHRLGITSQPRRSHTVQVPLSALSPPKANLGAVGGCFNSTTKIKCVPLPTIYHRHQITLRGVRNIRLHVDRYTPTGMHVRTISDSLLNLPKLNERQMNHLVGQETNLQKSRSLKKGSEVIPHRIEKAFYMSGHSAQLFDKQDIPQEELETLQNMSLSQNPNLYYGKGIQSGNLQSKAVQRFEQKIKQASDKSRQFSWEEMSIDAGRYSRASRAITPGPPIPEEDVVSPGTLQARRGRKVFVTESERDRTDTADD